MPSTINTCLTGNLKICSCSLISGFFSDFSHFKFSGEVSSTEVIKSA
ncbi:hypothetical protein IJ818_07035 [bacterium]|nr:hypothetical protein [bacterium]